MPAMVAPGRQEGLDRVHKVNMIVLEEETVGGDDIIEGTSARHLERRQLAIPYQQPGRCFGCRQPVTERTVVLRKESEARGSQLARAQICSASLQIFLRPSLDATVPAVLFRAFPPLASCRQ